MRIIAQKKERIAVSTTVNQSACRREQAKGMKVHSRDRICRQLEKILNAGKGAKGDARETETEERRSIGTTSAARFYESEEIGLETGREPL